MLRMMSFAVKDELAEYTSSMPAEAQSITEVKETRTLGWSSTMRIFMGSPRFIVLGFQCYMG